MNTLQRWMMGAGMLAAACPNVLSAEKTTPPNIIFILCDDMGYGDLGCYGQKYIHTPNIDRMAQEGMLFTQAYAGSPGGYAFYAGIRGKSGQCSFTGITDDRSAFRTWTCTR